MKGISVIKDFIVSILIVVVILLLICTIFYEDISLSKVISESEEYMLSEEMKKEIKDEKLEDMEEVVVEYKIDAYDMAKYEKNNEYTKGKRNPFSTDETGPIGNGANTGFYEDDGLK